VLPIDWRCSTRSEDRYEQTLGLDRGEVLDNVLQREQRKRHSANTRLRDSGEAVAFVANVGLAALYDAMTLFFCATHSGSRTSARHGYLTQTNLPKIFERVVHPFT
jgi:hypothetical protein